MTRFAFGRNWRSFLERLDEDRIAQAERSLVELLPGTPDLNGLRLLDIGSGSGLFSLAARRLGAAVHSFDADPESVACTAELRQRFRPGDPSWKVDEGSILDREYVERLGEYDIVYAWGVLHHTGDMWRAIENAHATVRGGGLLCLAIYNDQGAVSRRWRAVKRLYNRAPVPVRFLLLGSVGGFFLLRKIFNRLRRAWPGRTPNDATSGAREATRRPEDSLPIREDAIPTPGGSTRSAERGMSGWHDLVDWVGGYPFEVATPDAVVEFHGERGFGLEKMRTVGRNHGCNEFVFRRLDGATSSGLT